MAIIRSITIKLSVGARGRNDPADVLEVQRQLNALMQPPRVALKEDGRNGPKTEATIRDFQKSVLKSALPDGRVDPGGKTLARLNDPASEGVWAGQSLAPPAAAAPAGGKPPPSLPPNLSPAEKALFVRLWEAAERHPGVAQQAQARSFFFVWLDDMVTGDIQALKNLLNVQAGLAEMVLKGDKLQLLVKGVYEFSRLQVSKRDIGRALVMLHKARGFSGSLQFLGALDGSTRLVRGLAALGKGATVLGVISTSLECIDCFKKGQYGKGAGEVYKLVMGTAVPWAGLVDVLQSLVALLDPALGAHKNVRQFFAMLKHANPLAAGAVYIDTYVTVIEGIITLDLNQARFEALEERIKESPLAVYRLMGHQIGNWIGDRSGRWIYEHVLTHM